MENNTRKYNIFFAYFYKKKKNFLNLVELKKNASKESFKKDEQNMLQIFNTTWVLWEILK